MRTHFLIAAAMAGFTWLVGWWGVVVVALLLGVVFRMQGGRAWRVALGAIEGWGILLLIDVLAGPFGRVSSLLAGSILISAPALLLVTLLFPALLAWAAAVVGCELGLLALQKRSVASAP